MLERSVEVSDHPIFEKVSTLLSVVSDAEIEPNERERWERLTNLVRLLSYNVEKSVKPLIPSFAIESSFPSVESALNHCLNYIDTPDLNELSHALTAVEAAIRRFPYPFRIRSPNQAQEVLEEALTLKDELVSHIEILRNEVSSFQNEAASLQASFAAENSTLRDDVMAELLQVRSTLDIEATTIKERLDLEVSSLELEIANVETKASEALTDQNERFQEAQRERTNKFNSEIDALAEKRNSEGNEFRNLLSSMKSQWENSKNATESSFKKLLADSKNDLAASLSESASIRDEIREIAGLAGEEAMVGDFTVQANKKDKISEIYRWVSYVGFLGAAVFMAWMLIGISNSEAEFNWLSILTKTQIAFILFAPSAFFAYEARKLQGEARAAREIELRIKSFPQFARMLGDTERTKLYQDMAPIFFAIGKNADTDAASSGDLLKTLERMVSQLIKR